jgi:GxxExxY protein
VEIGKINKVTERIIGCAIEVHRTLGPGLLEALYANALCVELSKAGLKFGKEVAIPVWYKGTKIGEQRIDLLVEDEVIVELKAVDKMDRLFEAQLLSYLRVAGKRVGLLINFNSLTLRRGIRRMIV